MIRYIVRLAAGIMAMIAATAWAEPAKKLQWKDLVPAGVNTANPLSKLNIDQAIEFDNIVWAHNPEPGETPADRAEAKKEAKKSKLILSKQNIDTDKLYKAYERWAAEAKKRNQAVVGSLNGKRISLAGYLLPLEFSENGSTEFLLVPTIGACSHVPPPPINQTVFIRTGKPFQIEALYDPVWITGKMSAKRSSKSLNLVDGTSNVETGYTVSSAEVVEYTEE